MKTFLTVRRNINNPTSKTLETIFKEQSISSIFLSLSVLGIVFMILVLIYAISEGKM